MNDALAELATPRRANAHEPAARDLPLGGDATRRFIPLIVGAMVYLAALALAGTFALDGTVRQWSDSLRGALTVQLPGVAQDPEGDEAQARSTPRSASSGNVRSTQRTPLPYAQSQALLEPWLGAGDLPPTCRSQLLWMSASNTGARINYEQLGQALEDVVPGARINDNGVFLSRLVTLARVVQLVGIVVVFIVSLAAVSIVVFATRAGMTSHRDTIELLAPHWRARQLHCPSICDPCAVLWPCWRGPRSGSCCRDIGRTRPGRAGGRSNAIAPPIAEPDGLGGLALRPAGLGTDRHDHRACDRLTRFAQTPLSQCWSCSTATVS